MENHAKYILTESFCKDPVEDYLCQQRSRGTPKSNPKVCDNFIIYHISYIIFYHIFGGESP